MIYLVIFFSLCILKNEVLGNESGLTNSRVFDALIQPVIQAKCQHCHGAEKNKGKLRMHTKKDLLAGGSGMGENIIVKGNYASSELVYRIILPKEDEEAMPPYEDDKHYNPVTQNELQIMKSWIKAGASFDLLISELDESARKAAQHVLNNMPKTTIVPKIANVIPLPTVPIADPEILESLANRGIVALPIAQDTNAIYANASYLGKKFDDETLELLKPLSKQLLWLNIGQTAITDEAGPILSKFSLLTRLHLENTDISDSISPYLGKLENLNYLNLYGTKLGDSSVRYLKKLTRLEKIFLWQTNITTNGANSLLKQFVDPHTFSSLERECEKLSKIINKITLADSKRLSDLEKKLLKLSMKSNDQNPLNQKCPVSKKVLNGDHNSVYEGRIVGFCSVKCKEKFDGDQSSYRSKISDFKPSEQFRIASKELTEAQAEMDKRIENVSIKLRAASSKLKSLGPEINIGWISP